MGHHAPRKRHSERRALLLFQQEIGSNRLVLGIVHRVHIRDELIDPATFRIRQENHHPIGRMAVPDWYCRTADLFELPRPR